MSSTRTTQHAQSRFNPSSAMEMSVGAISQDPFDPTANDLHQVHCHPTNVFYTTNVRDATSAEDAVYETDSTEDYQAPHLTPGQVIKEARENAKTNPNMKRHLATVSKWQGEATKARREYQKKHRSLRVLKKKSSKTLKENAREHCDCGTPGFKAPEMYDESEGCGGYSLPVDLFAFGATIYELLSYTGKNWGWPYGWALDLATDEQVETAVLAGKPPTALGGSPVPSDCPAELRAIYQACVGFKPESRPTFERMVHQLRELLKTLREGTQSSASSSTEGNGAKAEGKKRKR